MSKLFVCLQFCLVREFAALAQLALLAGSAVVWTFVVVITLVHGIIVARCRRATSLQRFRLGLTKNCLKQSDVFLSKTILMIFTDYITLTSVISISIGSVKIDEISE